MQLAKLWVQTGTRAYLAAVGSCQQGGNGWARPQTFREIFVDSQFLGGVQVHISSGMKMASKNWAGMDSFPFTDIISFNIFRQFWAQRTVPPISS